MSKHPFMAGNHGLLPVFEMDNLAGPGGFSPRASRCHVGPK